MNEGPAAAPAFLLWDNERIFSRMLRHARLPGDGKGGRQVIMACLRNATRLGGAAIPIRRAPRAVHAYC
ncbi:MAG: hypothetical protein DI606_17500 [Sphingobium sp.]|nr:MAG: hypothetical protein DI606_17500 [Sphingobium sp.]